MISDTNLNDEFKKALEEAFKYVSNDEILTCIVHHVHDNNLHDLKTKVDECRHSQINPDLFNNNVQTLAALGLIYVYMNDTCSLTSLGEQLVDDLDRRGVYTHPLKSIV